MTTLLEKRQATAIKSLQKRKASAEAYIVTHTTKLEERLAPYRQELEVVKRMLVENGVVDEPAAQPKQDFEGDGHGESTHAE